MWLRLGLLLKHLEKGGNEVAGSTSEDSRPPQGRTQTSQMFKLLPALISFTFCLFHRNLHFLTSSSSPCLFLTSLFVDQTPELCFH